MATLLNPKHERFAQELAKGKSASEAYVDAGYRSNRAGACRLQQKANISQRVSELLARAQHIEEKAVEKAIDKLAITKEKVLAEMAKIGFADIRNAVEWRGSLTREEDNPDGGDVLVIKEIFSNHVRLIDSDKIDADTAAAIASVTQNATGGVSIKFHDKPGALNSLGKHLGLFPNKVELTGPNGGPVQSVSLTTDDPNEAAKAYQRIIAGNSQP